MTTDTIEKLKEDPAALRAMALGFLFDWLGSESFENPAYDEDLRNCPELKRFYPDDWQDQETRQLRRLVIDWLKDARLIRFQDNERPGRRRQKDYSRQEWARADRAVNGWWSGLHEESTLRRYRSVLGEYRSSQRTRIYVVAATVFDLFEECFGLPNECNATDFARANNLPTALVKAWVKELVNGGRLVEKKVRGKRLLRPVEEKQ